MKTKIKIRVQLLILIFVSISTVSFSNELSGALKMDRINSSPDDILIYPIQHASFVIEVGNQAIYVDPVGEKSIYSSYPNPNLILLTDIHGDHFNIDTINSIKTASTVIVAPPEVEKNLPGIDKMHNGETAVKAGFITFFYAPNFILKNGSSTPIIKE